MANVLSVNWFPISFPFANYVYETEKLFMNETCNETQIENGILCEDARKILARIWTFGIVVASLGRT